MSAPAPTFSRVGTTRLYASSAPADAGVPGLWAGYRSSAKPAFTGDPDLAALWVDVGGTYVFVAGVPADLPAFAAQLDALLAGLSPTGLIRAVWIADPAAPVGSWQVTALGARAAGSGPTVTWTVGRPATLAVGEYAVQLPAGAPLTPADATALGPGIAVGGLSFAGPGATCSATAGSAWLPLAGPTVGCWCARLTLAAGAGDGLDGLGVRIRYAAPHGDGAPGDPVDVLDAPVLAQGPAALALTLRFDVLHPFEPTRTRLGFFADDGSGPPVAPLAATLRTSRGYETTLAPRTAPAPLTDAGLVLGRTPFAVPETAGTAVWSHHLTPDGAFDLAVVPPANPGPDARHRLMLGSSGQEYVALAADAGAVVAFRGGQAAFAPGAAPDAPRTPPDGASPLTDLATTAHLAVLPPAPGPDAGPDPDADPRTDADAGLAYYAQPRQAPLYAAEGTSSTLGYLELVAATLPSWPSSTAPPPAVLPAAPLAGLAPAAGPLARRIEQTALAPARRRAVGLPAVDLAVPGVEAADPAATLAVTPQGLLVEAVAGEIANVVIAAVPGDADGRLTLTSAGPHLRAALQSNELFFAIGDPGAYLLDSSVHYRLDATAMVIAANRGVGAAVIRSVAEVAIPGGRPRLFDDEQAFQTAVEPRAGTSYGVFRELAGLLRADLDSWTFQLSPRTWRRGADPTALLCKYGHRALVDLAEDGAAWGWPGAAGQAQQTLRDTIRHARKRSDDASIPRDDPYVAFYRDVLADPTWNGVLVLNAPVAIDALPPELQFMAAGIAPDAFYAHHIGFSATPVEAEDGAIAVRRTAAFALIDYRDPTDLVLDPSSPNPDFGFKTLQLTAQFANATLTGFHARVELMVNRLLGAPLTNLDPTHGNNLVLAGTSQRQGGALSYAFALEGRHRYSADRTVIDTIEVDTVRALTTSGVDGAGEVRSTFALGGFLRFTDHPRFDAFAYGAAAAVPDPELDGRLRFDDLEVSMRFPLGDDARARFALRIDGTRLDPGRSAARRRSLVRGFPVALTGLVGSTTQPPQELGFASVGAPLDQSPLEPPWFGLTYTLDLGTLGALSGATGLTLTMLAAWGPAAELGARPAYIGLQLPAGMQWSLQSVMTLGFRSFQFHTVDDGPDLAYLLKLRRFALRILGISLPPGNLDLTLFGDPGNPESRTVGWYAAYDDGAERPAGPRRPPAARSATARGDERPPGGPARVHGNRGLQGRR